MASKSKKRSATRDGVRFVALPIIVLESAAYLSLSFSARALLIDLAFQYSGRNNGSLMVCDKVLKKRGWASATTIHKAKRELLDTGLLCETRKGQKPNRAGWFALTWASLDWLPDMDISRSGFPRAAYLKTQLDPQKME